MGQGVKEEPRRQWQGFRANTDITLLNPGRQDIKERQIQKITS